MRKYTVWLGLIALLSAVTLLLLSERVQFVMGGALVNLGYRMQDHLGAFDLVHHEDIDPGAVWDEVLAQNHMAASIRVSCSATRASTTTSFAPRARC